MPKQDSEHKLNSQGADEVRPRSVMSNRPGANEVRPRSVMSNRPGANEVRPLPDLCLLLLVLPTALPQKAFGFDFAAQCSGGAPCL